MLAEGAILARVERGESLDEEPADVVTEGGDWYFLEARGPHLQGAVVPDLGGLVARGDRGLLPLGDGSRAGVGRTLASASAADPPAAGRPAGQGDGSAAPAAGTGEDLRTLPVAYDASGSRFRDYRDYVDQFTTTDFPD